MLSHQNRRSFIYSAFIALSSIITNATQAALPFVRPPSQDQHALDAAIKDLFEHNHYTLTDAVSIDMPDLAEDGGNVPITIRSSLSNVRSISIFSDKNPQPLIATFKFSPTMQAFVKTRIKMAESGKIIVFVRTDKQLYRTDRALKVVLGGCDLLSIEAYQPHTTGHQ